MKPSDLNDLFIAPTFFFLSILCFFIFVLSMVGTFTISTSYVVMAFVFFLLFYASGRLGMRTAKGEV